MDSSESANMLPSKVSSVTPYLSSIYAAAPVHLDSDPRADSDKPVLNRYSGVCIIRWGGEILMPQERRYLYVEMGIARGHSFIYCANKCGHPMIIGRFACCDLQLNDSEVSRIHACVKWNESKMRWELLDLGSLNGTFLNSKLINNLQSGIRKLGEPVELENGDVISLGPTYQLRVHITPMNVRHFPFGFGLAEHPGGKKMDMEDVSYHLWPIPGVKEFGVFGICDGHYGKEAAKSASEIFPQKLAIILSDPLRRERVVSGLDASDELREALSQTEASMTHYYCQGCTITVALVWTDGCDNFFLQCANVGDSACILKSFGNQMKMTEDHIITNIKERLRMATVGEPLEVGVTRLHGLKLSRVLGDNFLKEKDERFSSEPYISEVVRADRSQAFAVIASNGLWDMVSEERTVELVLEAREKYSTCAEDSAQMIANYLLDEARAKRTRDNTSIIFLDFDARRNHG